MRAKLIINANAGNSRGRMLPISEWIFKFSQFNRHRATAHEVIEAVKDECRRGKISLDVAFTEYQGHAIKIARGAKDNYDIIIVAGGDGTINEVINGMVNSRAVLAVIPFGTCNVFASEIGIPIDVKGAARLITRGKRMTIDLGYAKTRRMSRYYSLVLSVGLDALLVKKAALSIKKGGSSLTYIISGLEHLIRYKWHRICVRHESTTSVGYFAFVANSRFIGCKYQISDVASMTDGFLDLVVIDKKDIVSKLRMLSILSTGKLSDSVNREYSRVKAARITCSRRVPVQVDGEVIGTIPVSVRIVPKALNVITGAKRSNICS
jgi:diacylglycerol kinase (ATP)